jgi:uncharacterized OB-fold protein
MSTNQTLPAPAPMVLPEVKIFWDATVQGRLLLPRCDACQTVIWYPRPFCVECASTRVSWFEASGRGQIYSYTINRRGGANHPDFRGAGEYVLAYVELEEGPRVLTNIVECDPELVAIGQAVEVVFHDTGEGSALVRFRPAYPGATSRP